MKLAELEIKLETEIANHVSSLVTQITKSRIAYRTIGFTLQGTYLFDFCNNEPHMASKIKPDFLTYFLSNLIANDHMVTC
jgi:hypothetical protein